eukprot:6481414-Amphidinium_carterae.3
MVTGMLGEPGHLADAGETLYVDGDILAEYSLLFMQILETETTECGMESFPGGCANLRAIVSHLTQ